MSVEAVCRLTNCTVTGEEKILARRGLEPRASRYP